jgi:hypothetical protein
MTKLSARCLWTFLALGLVLDAAVADDARSRLVTLEKRVEAAFLEGDVAFLDDVLAEDFMFSHATGNVASKRETIEDFARPGNFISRELTDVDIELHGDVALSVGRIEVVSSRPSSYTVCYVRLYMAERQRWRLASHRSTRWALGHEETCG